jgi:hypothetical protein
VNAELYWAIYQGVDNEGTEGRVFGRVGENDSCLPDRVDPIAHREGNEDVNHCVLKIGVL